ncbi:hypothetical protein BDA99DRAFT_535671 [Phascolomyces articulosus]|uniref:Uncharacterized protein n=1 Tax=Phascolomyces articulosus TaxID=60185 RepID=A0AAD5K3U9_9FUNG|nr:hypothetical protein BDA99DRAFT_535671 [Phascolomyces articulosus]
MPSSKLVRISEMQVVNGSHMDEGYCALSYSWNQSGTVNYEPFHGKHIRIDRGISGNNDKEEKKREILNMHHSYPNAYCTVVLVPELFHYNLNLKQGCFKRLWTLEEAIKSERLLFVGKDIHIWGENLKDYKITYELVKELSELNVNRILYHAHRRTSTKDHDQVFALIYLLPDIIDKIDIDYDQEPDKDLMIRYYGF